MKVWKSEAAFDLKDCVAVLGTFDGVHRGHQALIRRGMELAREAHTACVVYTFDRHPLSLLRPECAPEALLSGEEKLRKLEKLGVDGVLLQIFDLEFAALAPEAFLKRLVKNLNARGIVAGFNYTFGAGGRGDAALILRMAETLGYRGEIVDAVKDHGEVVSSSLLRMLRKNGDEQRFERLMQI